MPKPKYPLKPLLEHRERKVDDATAELGQAVRVREAADRDRALAESAKRDAEERARTVRAGESDLLGRGELRVADLARAEAWSIGMATEMAGHDRSVATSVDRQSGAQRAESGARTALATTMAERDVVAKDEARFAARTSARVLAAEEEAAEEAYRPRAARRSDQGGEP